MGNERIKAEDVIKKLKDDGDFDRLRLNIVRQLKLNKDLRNSIISVVQQSTALNRPDAENMNPRQLCDEIYDEIRETAMNQISNGVWEIIRSGDGMQVEIKETVESVYDKLLNPLQNVEGESRLSTSGQVMARGEIESNGPVMVCRESNGMMSDGEHKDALDNSRVVGARREPHEGNSRMQNKSGGFSPPPPGFCSPEKRRRTDAHAEDPDIPPGFG